MFLKSNIFIKKTIICFFIRITNCQIQGYYFYSVIIRFITRNYTKWHQLTMFFFEHYFEKFQSDTRLAENTFQIHMFYWKYYFWHLHFYHRSSTIYKSKKNQKLSFQGMFICMVAVKKMEKTRIKFVFLYTSHLDLFKYEKYNESNIRKLILMKLDINIFLN